MFHDRGTFRFLDLPPNYLHCGEGGGVKPPNYVKNQIVGPTLDKFNNMCQNVFDKAHESLI